MLPWFSNHLSAVIAVIKYCLSRIKFNFPITLPSRGICKCCGMKLKNFSLPDHQRIILQEKLKTIAENAIFSSNGIIHGSKVPFFASSSENDQSVKVHSLKHYIENNGPFDIALDVLNVAYYRDRGFNSFQVHFYLHLGLW